MASSGSSYLASIDKQFCQWPICLQQYREPKLLPCLHLYCSDCFKQLIEKRQEVNVVKCPKCRDDFTIPEKDVDEFNRDFYMNNIEYIQVQKSLEDKKSQECHSCSWKFNVAGHCFKCNGFLCKQCYFIHLTGKSLKDHKGHDLSLEDFKSNDMTLEIIADLKEAPRCESHPEDLCRLCFSTCDNLPICMKCTYGIHKNHDTNDVGIIAAEKREKLKQELKKAQEDEKQIDDVTVTERYNTLKKRGNIVLEARNDWTAVQCVTDICKAGEPLRKEMKRQFPELDTIQKIGVVPAIIQDEESPVDIDGIKANGWNITGIAGCDGGSIVITGYTTLQHQSHLTVINMIGKVLQKKVTQQACLWPDRYCAHLSKYKVATVCAWNEIGIFDIRDASYIKKTVGGVSNIWPVDWSIRCVATDPDNNCILVGGYESRDVYVFDAHLNYRHVLALPEMIKLPCDMVISRGNLMVCDFNGKRSYAVSTQRQVGKIIHEFKKPDSDRDDWKPRSVCKDSNEFIYILWIPRILDEGSCVVTQYSQDDYQLVETICIDCSDAMCVTTVNTGQTEKLVVADWESGKLYTYKLK